MAGERTCPHCGSTNTEAFEDGSGHCLDCDRSFLGSGPMGMGLSGEEVEALPTKDLARPKLRIGMLGVVGGLLGYLAVPAVFLLGAALRGTGIEAYTADVFNRPEGALVCGGLVLLVIFGWYATWGGFHVWRGFPERWKHLVAAGILLAVSGGLAGQGIPGAIGILGGGLTMLGGFLAWRSMREPEGEEESPPPAADAT